MSKNTVDPERPQRTIWRMRTACWIPKTTNTYADYVIIIAFLMHKWLHEVASVLPYVYIACIM